MLLAALLLSFPVGRQPMSLLGDATPDSLARQLGPNAASVEQARTLRFVRIRTMGRPDGQPWDRVLHVDVVRPIAKGDTILVTARLRSPTETRTSMHIEQAGEPFGKFVSGTFIPTKEWREYQAAGVADRDYAPGQAQLSMFLGYANGTIDVMGLSAKDLGAVPVSSLNIRHDWYGGLPNPSDWRPAAEKRIERYRKGDLKFQVLANGKPVRGAIVRVDQVRHRFRFGTAVPAFRIVSNQPDDVRFRRNLLRLFNTVVFENDLKWFTLDQRDYSQVDQALEWLHENRFDVRGHNLVWGSRRNLPAGLWEMSDSQLLATIHRRVTDTATRFRGKLYCWDVVNEAVSEHELWDRLGWDKFAQTFRWAREADPKAQLVYNENFVTEEAAGGSAHRKKVEEYVRYLIDHGASLDAIGIQAHVDVPMTPAKRVLEILDEVAGFKKPLEITEYDLSVLDDRIHARHMDDFLTACFSHPAVQSFLMWGFWEGSHWLADKGGAMFRRDWSERPTVAAYERLVKGKWWTRYASSTGRDGTVRTRAFYGTQKVTVSYHGRQTTRTIELVPGRPGVVVLRL